MNPSFQQQYFAKLDATYQANLAYFRKNLPHLAEQLQEEGITDVKFEVGDNGSLGINIDGAFYSEKQVIEQCQDSFRQFDDPEDYLGMTISLELVRRADLDIASNILDYYYDRIYETHKRRILDLLQKYTDGREDAFGKQPIFDKNTAPITLIFGTGYGWHLQESINRYKMRHLIIIDTDINITKLSLFFVDYARIHNQLSNNDCRFSIFTSGKAEQISESILALLTEFWPPFYMNGMRLLHNMRHVEVIDEVKSRMSKDFYRRAFMGWGFVDDELMSFRHSLCNFRKGIPIYKESKPVPKKAVAFIVGAGPSLDNLIETIRTHRDKAVVFSCGTALRVLAKAGIKPDYHIEIERPHSTYEALVNAVDPDYLADIPIIGLNVLYPDVFSLTRKPRMILKRFDSGSCLMKRHGMPEFITTPSVVNAALHIALHSGFENLYLFGTDAGFIDKSRHHASNTIYLNKDGVDEEFAQRMDDELELAGYGEGFKTVAGNFRETVTTNLLLTHNREMIEYVLRLYPQAKTYNLNDGARIDGAIPLPATKMQLGDLAQSKIKAIAALEASFSADYVFEAQQEAERMHAELALLTSHIEYLLSDTLESRLDIFDSIARVYSYVFSQECQDSSVFPMIKGTVTHFLRMIYDYGMYMRDSEATLAFAKESIPVIIDFLHATLARIAEIDLDNPAPSKLA